jgi:prolyl 4-hydroxylase
MEGVKKREEEATNGRRATKNGGPKTAASSSAKPVAAAESSKPKGAGGPPWIASLLVALFALGLGVLTPPIVMVLLQQKRGQVPSGTLQKQQHRTLSVATDACSEERLEEFWHDEPVPGFHIVCLDTLPSGYIRLFRGGTRETKREVASSVSSWDEFKRVLVRHLKLTSEDEMHQPWAIFSAQGERLASEDQEGDNVSLLAAHGLLLVFQGGQFLWPGVRLGFERTVDLYSIMPPGSPKLSYPERTVVLETLSLVPLVLSVKGFLSEEECEHIQTTATPSMRYSDVVLMDRDQGRPASDFRTSQTTFLSAKDEILTEIDYRTASLVRIPRNHQEPVQVLRYGHEERYTSHHDYFNPELYQADKHTLDLIGNGRRNRMVTVFWYLSDVEEGGETVFPRFNGGVEKSMDDCETGLKVRPEKGKVIIFYSMTMDGSMDHHSLHGACPVKEGVKWAANKWIWNEPMRYVRP